MAGMMVVLLTEIEGSRKGIDLEETIDRIQWRVWKCQKSIYMLEMPEEYLYANVEEKLGRKLAV